MEKEFEELKTLYQQKKASATLSVKVVDKKVKDRLLTLKKNHLINIATFCLTAIALLIIEQINSKRMETSSFGFWILMICSLYYAASKAYLLQRLQKIKPGSSVLQTIQQLEAYKRLNIWMHTHGEVIYVLVLSSGVYLYLRPVLDKFLLDKTGHTILCFWWIWGICILWMLIYTFVIKRRRMKKDIHILESYASSLQKEE